MNAWSASAEDHLQMSTKGELSDGIQGVTFLSLTFHGVSEGQNLSKPGAGSKTAELKPSMGVCVTITRVLSRLDRENGREVAIKVIDLDDV